MTLRVCAQPGCPTLTTSTRCAEHQSQRRRTADAKRPTAAQRGYGARWRARRARYLAANPTCTLCGDRSEVPDHWPVTRRQLVAQHDPDPDADHHLRPLCTRCHNAETARAQRRVGGDH